MSFDCGRPLASNYLQTQLSKSTGLELAFFILFKVFFTLPSEK
uniref:Uncharacterized protein n=1 Tax=Rhizophora mucronata TaxID=61149 RepID=A0A2P2ITI3_RHIMU